MEIRAASLRKNRFSSRVEVDPNSELKRRIYQAWLVYMEADTDAKTEAAYDEWASLIKELQDAEGDYMWG